LRLTVVPEETKALQEGQPPIQPSSDSLRGGPVVLKDPAEGRYLDAKMEPLTADRLRKVAASTAREDAPLVVAKRMPFRMHLVIDQRKLNRLLTAFCNATLASEIKQIRVGPIVEGSGAAGASRSARGFGGVRHGPDVRTGGPTTLRANSNVDIELFGIVYLFNPVPSTSGGAATPAATAVATPLTTTAGT
jgi:hypothetical protein